MLGTSKIQLTICTVVSQSPKIHRKPENLKDRKKRDQGTSREWPRDSTGGNSNKEAGFSTYRITNLRGLSERTGNRVKQITKHASAARLQAPKTNNRSHRLTASRVSFSYPRGMSSASHAASRTWLRCNAHVPLQGAEGRGIDAIRLTHEQTSLPLLHGERAVVKGLQHSP